MPRLVTTANALGRMAGRTAGQSRIFRGVYVGATTAAKSIGHVLRLFILQMLGLVFLLFAVALAVRIPHAYGERMNNGLREVYLLGGLSVMFLWFSISSFWRARKR